MQEEVYTQPATSKAEVITFTYFDLTLHEDSEPFPNMQVNAEARAAAGTSFIPSFSLVIVDPSNQNYSTNILRLEDTCFVKLPPTFSLIWN